MSYLVLARKYRPGTFDEVVGQTTLTGVLRGAIKDERVGHAYLFSGPRGTGKTTTARIFAKALNCEQGPTAQPCGTCDRCVAADAGQELDIIEIDAASHTGVGDIRELRDQAAYAPMRARYKVYIIDEVHMLSKSAFNALLKTLEEPPPHVKFLFATTEPQKLPDTILSRCQTLRLSPISEADIAGRLDFVMSAEGFTPEKGVSYEVARLARGGMRDALSMTDQLIALVGTSPTVDDVGRLGGEGGLRELDELLSAVEESNQAGIFEGLPSREGGEAEFLGRLLTHLRSAMIVAVCGAEAPMLEASAEERVVLAARAKRLGVSRLQIWLEELLAARERMRLLPVQARLALEVALLDLARPGGDWPLAELEKRLLGLEARLVSGTAAPTRGASSPPGGPSRRPGDRPPPGHKSGRPSEVQRPSMLRPDTSPGAATQDQPLDSGKASAQVGVSAGEAWAKTLNTVQERHGALAQLVGRKGRFVEVGAGVSIHFGALSESDERMLKDPRGLAALARAMSEAFGRELTPEIHIGKAEAPAPPPSTPEKAEGDQFADEVAEIFGGTLERDDDRLGR
jgi:DNA polymerase-3 subunit gamma/tau